MLRFLCSCSCCSRSSCLLSFIDIFAENQQLSFLTHRVCALGGGRQRSKCSCFKPAVKPVKAVKPHVCPSQPGTCSDMAGCGERSVAVGGRCRRSGDACRAAAVLGHVVDPTSAAASDRVFCREHGRRTGQCIACTSWQAQGRF